MLLLAAAVCLCASFIILGISVGPEIAGGARRRMDAYVAARAEEMESAFLDYDPRRVLLLGAGSGVLVFLCLFLLWGSPIPAAAAGISLVALPHGLLSRARSRRAEAFEGQLPDALASVANAMRAGLSFPQALESASRGYPPPLSQEVGLVLKEMSLGRDMGGALAAMARRVNSIEAGLLAVAVSAMRDAGGNASDILEKIALTLRERRALEGKIRALTAQGRFQGMVIGAMPVALGAALYVLDPPLITRLFTEPLGWGILGLCVVCEAVGIFFIRKIVAIDI